MRKLFYLFLVCSLSANAQTVTLESLGITGDGTDEGLEIQAALNATTNTKLVGTPGKTYIIGQFLIVPSNKTFDGNGATLKPLSGLVISSGNALIGTNGSMRQNTIGTAIDVVKGSYTFIHPEPTEVAIGENVALRGPEYYSNGSDLYYHGWYGTVVAKSGSTITLSHAASASFTSPRINTYRTTNNIHILNWFIDMRGFKQGKGVDINHTTNSSVEGCRIESDPNDGIDGGIFAEGVNLVVKNNIKKNMELNEQSKYAINPQGQDIIVEGNLIEGCRSGISSGIRDYYATGIIYRNNTVDNSIKDGTTTVGGGTMLGFHANTFGIIEGNTVRITNPVGYNLHTIEPRGGHAIVRNNKITVTQEGASTAFVIYLYENATDSIQIYNNEVYSAGTGTGTIAAVYLNADIRTYPKNLSITKNYFEGSILFNDSTGENLSITDNRLVGTTGRFPCIRWDAGSSTGANTKL